MANTKSNNRKKNGKPVDFILVVVVLVMLALGIVMVLSASSPSALSKTGKSYVYVRTQAFCAVLGLVLMTIISNIDYRVYKKFYKIAYIGTILILLAVLIPNVGSDAGGAVRWIDLGFITFQPSEIAKIALVIFYAALLTNNRDKLGEFFNGFVKPILWILPVLAILIFAQSHLSASILIVLIVSIMMLMAGTKLRYFLTLGSAAAVRRRRSSLYFSEIF